MDQDELLRLIDQAAREGWTELDLSNQGLTELPSEIGSLTRLESLDLSHDWRKLGKFNKLVVLPPEIGCLARLRHLNLSFNQLKALPPEIGSVPQQLR